MSEITIEVADGLLTVIDRAPLAGEYGFWIGDQDALDAGLVKLLIDRQDSTGDGVKAYGWFALNDVDPIHYDDDGTRPITVVWMSLGDAS